MQQIWDFLHLFRMLHSPASPCSLFTVVFLTNLAAGLACCFLGQIGRYFFRADVRDGVAASPWDSVFQHASTSSLVQNPDF